MLLAYSNVSYYLWHLQTVLTNYSHYAAIIKPLMINTNEIGNKQ